MHVCVRECMSVVRMLFLTTQAVYNIIHVCKNMQATSQVSTR